MKHLLIALLLVGCATTVQAPPPPPTPFEIACKATSEWLEMEDSCYGVDEPLIVYTQLIDELPCWGCKYKGLMYPGEGVLMINNQIPENEQKQTTIHELIHHISYRYVPNKCENEELARRITASIFDDMEYDDKWRVSYRCPGPTSLTIVFPE